MSTTLNYPAEPMLLAANDTTDLMTSEQPADLISSAPPAKIGIVSATAEGPITAQDQDGAIRVLHEGDPVYLHDLIVTPAHSYVKITLMDDTLFQLGPHSRASLDKYAFDPAVDLTGEFEAFVFSGAFRYISGKISGNNQGQHTLIKTPSANIGIRGSEIDAVISEDGSTTVLHLSGLITINSRYHAKEVLVYERGTSIYIPNENVSYTVNQLTEDKIQQRNQEWQIFNSSQSLEDKTSETTGDKNTMSIANSMDSDSQEDKDPPSSPQSNGPRHPFSLNQIDPNSDESVDDIISENDKDKEGLIEKPARLSETINRASPLDKTSSISEEEDKLNQNENKPHPVFDDFNQRDKVNTSQSEQEHEDIINPFQEPLSLELPPKVELLPSKPVDVPQDEPTSPVIPEPIEPEPIEPELIEPEPVEPEPVEPEPVEPEPVEPEPVEPEPVEPEPVEPEPVEPEPVEPEPVEPEPVEPEPSVPEPVEPEPIEPPISQDDTPQPPSIVELTLNEDSSQLIQVLSSAETETNIQLLNQPGLGTVIDNGNGTLTYTPKPHLNGEDTLTYLLNNSETIIVKLTIVPVNDAPIAVDDTFSINNNTGLTISAASLIANDQDVEHDSLSIIEVRAPIGGIVSFTEDNMVFIPNNGLSAGGFEYVVSDGSKTDIGQVNITRTFQPLIANDDGPFNMGNHNSLVIEKATLLGNDQFSESESPQFRIIQSINGQVQLEANGNILFTRGPNFEGQGEFDYQISDGQGNTATAHVTVIGENRSPDAQDDGPFDMGNNDSITLITNQLLGNDFDPDGDPLTIIEVNNSINGQVQREANGNIVFTRGPNFDSNGEFDYQISDGKGGFDTARVTVTGIKPLIATPDNIIITESTPIQIDSLLLNNDITPDNAPLQIINITPAVDSILLSPDTGEILFTPPADFFDKESQGITFSYEIRDEQGNTAETTATLTPFMAHEDQLVTSDPTSVLLSVAELLNNDTYPQSEQIEFRFRYNSDWVLMETNNFVIIPSDDFINSGINQFDYQLSDSHGNVVTATVNLGLIKAEDDVVAANNPISIDSLLANDNIPEWVTPTLEIKGQIISLEQNVIPNGLLDGLTEFDYQISDGENHVSTAHVVIQPDNDETPIPIDDKFSTFVNKPLTILAEDLLANDIDPDGDQSDLFIARLGSTTNGSKVTQLENGNLLFQPASSIQEDRFAYTIQDSDSKVSPNLATITITVSGLINDDHFVTNKNNPLTFQDTELWLNDQDVQGQTVIQTDNVALDKTDVTTRTDDNTVVGTVEYVNGQFTLTAIDNYVGEAVFGYTLQDALGRTTQANVTIQVENTPPVAEPDTATVIQNSIQNPISVLENDNDNDPQETLTIQPIQQQPTDGTVEIVDNQIFFTPNADFVGTTHFDYTIADRSDDTKTNTVTITVETIAPIITLPNSNTPLDYNIPNKPLLIDSSANVFDQDSRNFDGGTLEIAITQNYSRYDVLEIQNQGPITVSSSNGGVISYNGTPIGNFTTHFATGALLVSFNIAATPETTTALLEAISYKNTAEIPLTETRTVEFTLTDGDGGTSNIASRYIEVTPPEPVPLEIKAENDQIEIPFNQPVSLSIPLLLDNDKPANPDDILRIGELSNLSPGIEAKIVGDDIQLFIDALVNNNFDEAKFDYTVTDDEGRQDTATVTLAAENVKEGTPNDDLFTGTDGIDIFMGQEGNDTFQPSLGPDILSGGENDDLFLFDPSTANGIYISGDTGLDTLRLNGADNQRLDLLQNRNLSPEQQFDLQGLEKIDLSAGSNNELRLSLQDVLDITDDNNSLLIEGNESNRVISTGEGWNSDGIDSSGLYNRYTSGDAELLVSADITNQFIS